MTRTEYARSVQEHYARVWSPPTDVVRWSKGPVSELPEEFRVLVVSRSADMTAYATRCMSQLADEDRLEIHLFTKKGQEPSPEVIEVLTAVAHYHRTGRALGLGHSVNFGRPWVAGSACTHGLLSLPYLDGPDLEWLAAPRVRFLWMIPITEAEVRFKKTHGMEALEQKFEESRFDFLDPLRASVA